ncbi:orotate phosphoribosyltransferase [Sandaracinomonas limnophila]|uniref:Orotate phosphoribosyltransferase n=1 Tax=Sandaracinomonas limnophila TaxID=1862386 RepID=A0A437PX89_9BACT|nr:orotate phosphoribosyltransferase [Sandaracinomonas limnophila]RVU26861.1 orotate phosphoribosyltransferase [Sandaracinomonas limnophila]
MENISIQQEVAQHLLEVKAIQLRPNQPFKWASGWNSPIYCDNRISLSYPKTRTYIKNALSAAVKGYFPEVEIIAGVATAGIAQGALVSDYLDLPFCYVRPEPKKHGMGNQIEGKIEKGQKVVLIEDLISTGGSSLKAAEALIEAGAEVLGMVAIFSYGFEIADQNFKSKNIPFFTLSNYDVLIEEAVKLNYVTEPQLVTLQDWRVNPSEWRKEI